ncbi:cadherin-99C [Schistocerca americana]|uniref:cadherin-99C n=1 Tax=Schistocerca americana TaxID=7009 RepID=UPI001F500366|nr:cadherin-99C [Schistocerca americana]XP_047001444.1 cadherin-99C [Schistocerca americana]
MQPCSRSWVRPRVRALAAFLAACLLPLAAAKPGLCELESGQSNIILDIEESSGSQMSQQTTPAELPVVGDPFSDVALELVFPRLEPIFILNGKRLQLLRPLDRDRDNLSHIVFQLTCTVRATGRKRTIPVIVRVSDVNDNAPVFLDTPYEVTVPELTPVGSTVFRGLKAVDADAGVNALVEYSVVAGQPPEGEGSGAADGAGFFAIRLPHQGQVTVARALDYERTQRYLVTVVASDRARNASQRLSATATLTVTVQDDDDQEPSFIYQGCTPLNGVCINPEYSASVSSGILAGILSISPEKIQAVDMDSINSPIHYSFLSGMPSSYKDYFEINPQTGAVRQIQPVDTSVAKKFEIIIKAEEESEQRRFATAKLFITVKPVDSNPPKIQVSAADGFVDENAPIGTKVIDASGNPIKLTVTDADLGPDDPKPTYAFELTTNFFKVDNSGILVVNEETLDRDPPSPGKFRFQVVAREMTGGNGAASRPLTLTVTLNDVNDNAPRLPAIAPITIQAGEGKRLVYTVVATDDDLGENAEISYSIYHVSNNGRQKFKIEPKTGEIFTIGKLIAGEQYSITVQATDKGGKYSQTIVEVNVVPGPNTRSPVFEQQTYEVQVSEGAPINSTVATIIANDPEKDPVTYSIISGNDLRQFAIGDRTGVITVIRKLDREELTRYQLVVKAEDTGGLSSTALISIKVTDINDKNPEFQNLPYLFRVREGENNAKVGSVLATDADEGQNAVVYYSVPDEIPFAIDAMTGEIRTKTALDYEKQRDYKFVVTAKDGAPDPRLATATVTVQVVDIDDELPIFHLLSYEARVPENVPDYMVTQVKADDPDTNQKITYIIRQGPAELFSIDQKTGVIRTLRGLDYERESQYILVIGTLENPGNRPGDTTRVIVNVEDRNDIPPVFTTVPRPVTLEDSVPIGTTVTTLIATDSDGTPPGNKVRYELIGRGKANKYFQIDSDTGVIHVRDDLRKETLNEYQVDIKAYDLGEPQLSSVTSVPVYVRHVATVPPDEGLGFADTSYTVEIPENATAGTLIKTLTILNIRAQDIAPLRCTITDGDIQGLFYTNVTKDRNCELRLRTAGLDHEKVQQYQVAIKLDTLSGLVNQMRNSTTVKIQVVDVNDNKPEFIFPEPDQKFSKGKYFGAIAADSPIGTSVLQVKAEDKDSGKYGKVEYRILASDRGSEYFAMDSSIIKSKKLFDNDVGLPFRFTVEARDNPTSEQDSNTETVPVVINLITDRNRLILVIDDAKPETIQNEENKIASVLEDHTNLIIGIEKVDSRQFLGSNSTIEIDKDGTDVWFYAVDPETETILERNSSRVLRSIMDAAVKSSITRDIGSTLQATTSGIHGPLMVMKLQKGSAVSWDVFPYALIIIACIIFILGSAGIIYICISWSRYKAYKERMQRMYVVPRYDPVFVEPNLKEYETQVLQMSVPLDDSDSYNDLQLDFSSKNHAFSLDNVSYITKENGDSIGQQSPVSSDAATTARASSIAGGGHHRNESEHNIMGQDSPHISNPVYQRSDDNSSHMNASATNENVTFREKKDYSHLGFTYLGDRSPVETTTEL